MYSVKDLSDKLDQMINKHTVEYEIRSIYNSYNATIPAKIMLNSTWVYHDYDEIVVVIAKTKPEEAKCYRILTHYYFLQDRLKTTIDDLTVLYSESESSGQAYLTIQKCEFVPTGNGFNMSVYGIKWYGKGPTSHTIKSLTPPPRINLIFNTNNSILLGGESYDFAF